MIKDFKNLVSGTITAVKDKIQMENKINEWYKGLSYEKKVQLYAMRSKLKSS